jgi:transposase-like protein
MATPRRRWAVEVKIAAVAQLKVGGSIHEIAAAFGDS